ncbi:MAG: VWA domain-containing protein [Firmicutes bacterium]|nr:VWA domain-containing protein [Bacillota bacterium]
MKRKIALLTLTCILFTACGQAAQVNKTNVQAGKVATTSTKKVVDDKAIEERIKAVGESYDGLYRYDEDADFFGGATNSLSGAKLYSRSAPTAEVEDEYAVDAAEPMQGIIPTLPNTEPDWNTENFKNIEESGITSVKTQPFSTFGADVDTASYSSLRRRLFENDGHGITDNALRVEELVNYFGYDYPQAEKGEKFGVVTSLTSCPWVDDKDTYLLRVGIKAEEVNADKGSNIVFLVDTSGSMFTNNKLPLVQKALTGLQEKLTDKDTISIVTYAGEERVVCEGVKGSEHEKIQEAIDSFQAWGSTNGESGINKAYELAEKYFIKDGNNRVLLATDGDLNVGVSSEAGLIELIEEKKKTGVFLSCLGFGDGNYKDDKMEALADHGNGNYSFIDCSREAERVLKDEFWSTLFTVAKDVKFQVEFNPDMVKGYRLVGYENRAMAAEDFANDTKDGGEVGSGQCVTALYEIILKDSKREVPTVESRYNSGEKSSVNSDELLTVNIRYKEPNSDKSELRTYPVTKDNYTEQMDDDTSWAAGVAQFGMLVRESEYKGTSSFEQIYDRLKYDPRIMEDDFRAEFLYLVSRAKTDKEEKSGDK